MPTTMLWLMTNGQWPQRVAMSAENEERGTDGHAPGKDDTQVLVRLGERGPDARLTGLGDGEGEHAVEVEARRRQRR